MLPEIISAIIGAATDTASTAANVGITSTANRRSYKWTKKMAEYQYQKNLEQWNRENLYNHPMQQMQRLQEAGLNPNLVFANGGLQNTSASSPEFKASQFDDQVKPIANLSNPVLDYYNVKQSQSSIDLQEKQREYYEQQTLNLIKSAEYTDTKIAAQRLANSYNQSTLDNRVKILAAGLDNKVLSNKSLQAGIVGKLLNNQYLSLSMPYKIRNLDFQSDYIRAQTRKLNAEREFIIGKKGMINDQIELLRANKEWKQQLLTPTKNALDWKAKNLKRDYKWKPINNIESYMNHWWSNGNGTLNALGNFAGKLK